MTDIKAVRYEQEIQDVLAALADVHTKMDSHGLDRTIHHLVQLRASQINRCGFCVKMGGFKDEARLAIDTNGLSHARNAHETHLLPDRHG